MVSTAPAMSSVVAASVVVFLLIFWAPLLGLFCGRWFLFGKVLLVFCLSGTVGLVNGFVKCVFRTSGVVSGFVLSGVVATVVVADGVVDRVYRVFVKR